MNYQISGSAVYNDFNKEDSGSFTSMNSNKECCQNQHSKLNLNSNILPVQDKLSSTSFRLLKRKNCESKMILSTTRSDSSRSIYIIENMKGGRK